LKVRLFCRERLRKISLNLHHQFGPILQDTFSKVLTDFSANAYACLLNKRSLLLSQTYMQDRLTRQQVARLRKVLEMTE
jgi:hypothetical protein